MTFDVLDYFPGGRVRQGIHYNPQGIPYGSDVFWVLCDHCGGEGIDYYDAENARECPDCQGIGKVPYENPTHGAWRENKAEDWTCADGHYNPAYVKGLCREPGCFERKAA